MRLQLRKKQHDDAETRIQKTSNYAASASKLGELLMSSNVKLRVVGVA
jgi:hypothetical protein